LLPDLPPGPGPCTGCGGPTGDAKMAVCVYCTAFALEDTGAGEMQVISKLDRLLDRLIATMMLVGLVLMISVIMMVLR
jgi:hypothetical protein